MCKNTDQRNQYYQIVTRTFLNRRGAPFFLSSREIDMIRSWESREVPLRVVLEGIKNFFEKPVSGPGRKKKAASLVLCDSFVQKAFLMSRTRKIGREQKIISRDDKKSATMDLVRYFLQSLPEEMSFLQGDFHFALQILEKKYPDEEKLEKLDRTVDEKLINNASESLVKRIRSEVLSEYLNSGKEEINRIIEIKLSRFIRERFQIPHLSLFYY